MAQSASLGVALLEAFDQGPLLAQEDIRAAIYGGTKRSYGVKRKDAQKHERLCADSSKVMEELIPKAVYSHRKSNFTPYDGWTLVDHVNHKKEAKTGD
jgi:hypothetical protein